jgi:hypothetical protein
MNTVITHFYNEEYFLPWWIKHHKKIFDNGIMINYDSTDKSLEICKELCPKHWKIVDTVNDHFLSSTNDAEVKVYENNIEGFKMVLTVTEFLLLPTNLENINRYIIDNKINYLKTTGVCMVDNDLNNLPTYDKPLFAQKHNGVIRNYIDPSSPWMPDAWNYNFGRYYHNQQFGKYSPGRHNLINCNNILHVSDIFTLKYKYCPWNDITVDRIKKYESKVKESWKDYPLHSEQEHHDSYNYYLKLSHDLKNDFSFNVAYDYCLGLV